VKAAVTISLIPQARGGPFVFWDDLAAGCEQAAALGFHAVEIFTPSPEAFDGKALRRLLTQHRLQVAAFGTGAAWVIHKWRLCDASADVRTHARGFVRQMIDLAGQFGAPVIIGSIQGRAEGDVSRPQALGWLGEALDELGSHAERHGQPILFEPLNRYETNLFNRLGETAAFLKTLGAKNLRILADLFHANIEESSIPEALRAAGPLVGHVHFVDSNRQAVGFGHTDMRPIAQALREIDFKGFLSAEVLPLPDSYASAQQTMRAFKQFAAA
jgi:sugar phosphate isomerase/epimerase